MAEPFLSEIRIFSFDFPPKGWAFCNGQSMMINQNQALFALLGTTFGGNGQTTFNLPNLQGRTAIHSPQPGEAGGQSSVSLNTSQLPSHTHLLQARNAQPGAIGGNTGANNKYFAQAVAATSTGNQNVNIYGTGGISQALNPTSVTNVGGSQPHTNMQPYLVLNFCIALTGIFPSRN